MVSANKQLSFFEPPKDYTPRPAACFVPERIIYARGSERDPGLADAICRLYPQANILKQPNVSHARIDMDGPSLLSRHQSGKRTLVFGELKDAVRFSAEAGNTCPNYWHFSPYGFCPYGCHYCYLAGTIGVKFSPTVKIFLNLPEMLRKIDAIATRLTEPTAFYVGKLQDGLALDPLTGYSRIMVPFFAGHPIARLVVLTKSADVQNLLDLDHNGHTALAWSLNPPAIAEAFETNTPSIASRLLAMEQCAAAGYPVRAVVMPLVPVPDWPTIYGEFLGQLLTRVPLQRLTLGGICSYQTARGLMNEKLARQNTINEQMKEKSPDGRLRYPAGLRIEMYSAFLAIIRRHRPDLPVALCLEQPPVRSAVGLDDPNIRCNCLW